MSYIVIKAVPEELKNIAEKGNLIMYNDLSLYVKTQSDTIEKVKGEDYDRIMDYLNKSMGLHTAPNYPFVKKFLENESHILVYETDTNILTSIDEVSFKSETGLKIKYEVGQVPEYFTPMGEVGNTYYLNDPANANNPTKIADIITSLRNRLTYIQSILDICILGAEVENDLTTKYLADGEGFNNTKYPYLKNITDDIATGNVNTGDIETTLSSTYLPKGNTFNATLYPNVKTVTDYFGSVKLNTKRVRDKIVNEYLPKGASFNASKYPNMLTIVNYVNSMMDTIKAVLAALPDRILIGTPMAEYPDAYAIVTKLTTLSSNIANIRNTIDTLRAKVSNYLPKADTTYTNVAYLVSEINSTKTEDATNFPKQLLGEPALSSSYNTALEIAALLESLITSIKNNITDVVANKLQYSDSFDIATYPNAQVIANKISELYAEEVTQEEEFNSFIEDILPVYLVKNGFVPYKSLYKMYLDMLYIQTRMVRIDKILNAKVCEVLPTNEKFTRLPLILMDVNSGDGSNILKYIGGSSTPVCGTRLHPYYFATCVRDDSQTGTCDPIFQMAYKHSNGKYYAIKLPWEEWAEGTWDNDEYRDHIMTWVYGAGSTTTIGGQGQSLTINYIVEFTFAANRSDEGSISESFHDCQYWSNSTFAAGCRGIDGLMYVLTYTGNLVKLDIPAFVTAWAAGSAALANYATPLKNLASGDTWLSSGTFNTPAYYNGTTLQGFGYWSRRRSHIVDTGRVGGNKIVCVGARYNGGSLVGNGPQDIILCVYNKIANKSALKSLGGGVGSDITYITPLSDKYIYWENSIHKRWGIIEINWSGSDFEYVKHEYTNNGILPIMCAIQNTDIVLVMDVEMGTYHFIKNTNLDVSTLESILKRNDSFGLINVTELVSDSPFRELYMMGRKYTVKNSTTYELFMGLNDGGRHIVYEPDQDDIMTLCVNNGRFKFTGKAEGIVITGEAFPIT